MYLAFFMNLAGSVATGLMFLFALRYYLYIEKSSKTVYLMLTAASFLLWNVSQFISILEAGDIGTTFFITFVSAASITPAMLISDSLKMKRLRAIEFVLLLFSWVFPLFQSSDFRIGSGVFFTLNASFVSILLMYGYLHTRSFNLRSKIASYVAYYGIFSIFEVAVIWIRLSTASIWLYVLSANFVILPIYLYILMSLSYGRQMTRISINFWKNVLYGVMISAFISFVLLVGYYVNLYFSGKMDIFQSFFVSFIIVFFFFLAFSEYLKKIDTVFEGLLRTKSSYSRSRMIRLVKRMLEVDTLEELDPILADYCDKVFETRDVELFFMEDDETFRSSKTLLKIEDEVYKALSSERIFDLYTLPYKEPHFYGKELLVWMKNMDKIEGFVLLGHRRTGRYTPSDTEAINMLANQLTFFMSRYRSIQRVRNAERSMIFQERMASLGRVAFGMAHEIRNPLNIISTSMQLLRESPSNEKLWKYIHEELERINSILGNFLDFSRQKSPSTEEGNVSELVRKTAVLLNESASKRSVEIGVSVPEAVTAKFDKTLLMEILLNLGTNALDAVGDNGRIDFRLSCRKDYFKISVSNNGRPIGQEELKHIFEPFYTTKENGTGLGLAIVYNYIQSMGGYINVKSDERETVFTVFIYGEVKS